MKKDNLIFGIMAGLIAPVFGVIIYYFVVFYNQHVGFIEYLGYLQQYKTLLTGVSSLSLIANAVLFTIYINGRRDETAKGIFVATIVYGIGVLLVKTIG